MKLLIVHISDIHLRETRNPSVPKFAFVSQALQNEEVNLAGVLVVISGDIAYSGTAEEYKIALECLGRLGEDLRQKTNVPEVRFIFVPGNHDCDFKNAGSTRETIINAIRKGISAPIDSGMIELCSNVQAEFFQFRDSFPNGPTRNESLVYWEYLWEKDGCKVLFRCFNTAWLSQLHEQQGGLFFPEAYLSDSEPQTKADYYIAVFHHPYNWFPAATYRQFRAHIEKTSDLILTGHEHEPDHYQKYTFRGEVNEYLEGAVFQEMDHPERAGFHAIYIDLASQRQRIVGFSWQNGMFVPAEHGDGWAAYKRGSRTGVRDFVLSEDFGRWLDDPGAMFSHPVKQGDLTLSDIFVFPNLKEFRINDKNEFIYGSLVEGRDLLKTLGAKPRALIFGRQQAGKTTLAKVLFRNFYYKGLTPVLVSAHDITQSQLDLHKFEELVESEFQRQYNNPLLPKFQQLDRDKTFLLIDDFDHARLNPKGRLKLLRTLEARYDRIFVFADDVIKLEEMASGKESCDILADYNQFELVQFGYLLRSKLIEQWYSIGSEYVSSPEELLKKNHRAETLITSLLGKNYLPSFPVFILSLLQAYDSGSQLNSNVGTYGGLYEVLIFQALATRMKGGNLDLKKTYLSEFAYWMFSHEKRRITEEDWIEFHGVYCSKYKIKPSRQELRREFGESGLLEQLDQKFGFRHSYAYYYFVARYLRDNITNAEIRHVLESLCEKLDKEENASIWLFLTHLSKDPFLLEVILKHARKTYERFQPATFSGDVVFLADLAKSLEQVVLEDKDFEQIKEERLRKLDSAPCLAEQNEVDAGDGEGNELVQFISELNLALRTLEVLGQIVKNFPGSLVGTDKFALVKEAYEVGLRTISMMLDLFKGNSADFVELVVDRVMDNHPELKDKAKRADLEKNLKSFLFWMIEISCFGVLKRISNAVGHSQLTETYEEVRRACDTNSVSLIDVSVQLDNVGIPDDRLELLAKRFKDNIFCERLLRQMVVQHFYLFPTKETTKQKVCALLDIPIRNVRGLDVQSKGEKLAPPAP
jgi:hypothetical protein